MNYDVVVPTIGRPSLTVLLTSLARAQGPLPDNVFVVDDRRDRAAPLFRGGANGSVQLGELAERVRVVAGAGAGPAAARNRGWRSSRAPWIAFLDDDVVVEPAWRLRLVEDLAACKETTAGSQGRVTVPPPNGRRATDWERNVGALEEARWITADCAYRRDDLQSQGGFDERFPRAYREDADFALRLFARGRSIAVGSRRVEHPVRCADPWISVRLQAGNADDALMDALHGAEWRALAGAPRGRFRRHVLTVACGCASLGFATLWAAATARFAWERIVPGPRDAREIRAMLATSALIPLAAVYHRLRGRIRAAQLVRQSRRERVRTSQLTRPTLRGRQDGCDASTTQSSERSRSIPAAVLFDRDGTLVVDEPALRDPARVRLVPGARVALDRLREAGIAVGIVTNQPAVGEGRLSPLELTAIHARLTALAGPFAAIETCVHSAADGCVCRKPQPGLVLAAAERLALEPQDCVVVGDIGSDVAAAAAAGARAILVPTSLTLAAEVAQAPAVARDLQEAVDRILAGCV